MNITRFGHVGCVENVSKQQGELLKTPNNRIISHGPGKIYLVTGYDDIEFVDQMIQAQKMARQKQLNQVAASLRNTLFQFLTAKSHHREVNANFTTIVDFEVL